MIDPNLDAVVRTHQMLEEALARKPEPYDQRTLDAAVQVIEDFARGRSWASDIRLLRLAAERVRKLGGDRG